MPGETLILQGLQVSELLNGLRQIIREEIKHANGNAPVEEKLLSPAEACKVWKPTISKSTLHNWSEKGLLQAHYIGGRKYYRLSEILAKLETLKPYSKT